MSFQHVGKLRAALQCGCVFFIGEKLDAFLLEERRFRRKTSGRFVLAGQFLGFDLTGLDVRLVEGVDADDGAGDGSGDFPAEKFLAESIRIRERDAHDGVPGLFERGNRGILRLVGLRSQAQIREYAIVAIGCRLGEALAIDGNDALADFPDGFSDQLFEPRAEIEDSWGGDDRNFVPAMIGGHAQDVSKNDARIGINGRGCATTHDHLLRVFLKFRNVEAHNTGGYHAEVGERGITATDARNPREYLAELIRFGDLLQLGARISDGDEAVAGFFFAHPGLHALEKVLLVNVGLKGASGLARNDADGALEVHFRFDGLDLRGVGGIENVQLGKTFDLSEGHAQNFGTEAGATHPQQERMLESRLLHVLGDPLESVNVGELLFGDGEPAEPITLVGATPERSILLPKARNFIILLPLFERRSNRPCKRTGQLVGLAVYTHART